MEKMELCERSESETIIILTSLHFDSSGYPEVIICDGKLTTGWFFVQVIRPECVN